MKRLISILALLLVIMICISLTAVAADDDNKWVYLAKDQCSVESEQLAWTSAKIVAYNSDSSAHNVKATVLRSDGERYYTVVVGELAPDSYWHYTSVDNDEWALFKLRLSVVNELTGCIAGAHLQQPELEEEWED